MEKKPPVDCSFVWCFDRAIRRNNEFGEPILYNRSQSNLKYIKNIALVRETLTHRTQTALLPQNNPNFRQFRIYFTFYDTNDWGKVLFVAWLRSAYNLQQIIYLIVLRR